MLESDRQTSYLDSWQGEHYYGMQFGDPHGEHLQPVCDLIAKYCTGDGIEIGSGGGRWTREIIKHCNRLLSIDGTAASEHLIRESIDCEKLRFRVCADGEFEADLNADFAFSFDVFVHFHSRLFLAYIDSIQRALTPGGFVMLHYARYLAGSQHNSECFKYWDRSDVLAEFDGFDLLESIEFPSGFGSELLVLQQRNTNPYGEQDAPTTPSDNRDD